MRKTSLILGTAALLLLGAACTKTVNTNQTTNDDHAMEDSNGNTNQAMENQNSNSAVKSEDNTNVMHDEEMMNDTTKRNANESDDAAVVTSNGSLTVTKPEKDADVESPFAVEGKSSATTVYVRLKSASGKELFTVPVTVRDGAYHVNLTYQVTNTTNGVVEVFEKDASGNETLLTSVTITLKTESSDTTNSNDNENSNSNDNTNSDDSGSDS